MNLGTQFVGIVKLGVKSLLLHKLRSILTMLGIIFGVCSVIAMLAIGEGASYEAQESIKKLGSNNIILKSVKPPEQQDEENNQQRSFSIKYGLTYEDAARIQETIPGVEFVLPMRIISEKARFNENEVVCNVIATLPNYLDVVGAEIMRGRFISMVDQKYSTSACVLTAWLASQLFPYQDPIGQTVQIDGVFYEVVGISRERNMPEQRTSSGNAREGDTVDNNVYISLSTGTSRFGEILFKRSSGGFSAEEVQLHQITIRLRDIESVETADPQIKDLLKKYHDKVDYETVVPLELLRQAEETKRRFNIVLGSIAAISLLVGGIGIMNIMLASVTERTREIGVRRALGAKQADIVTQFLVETVVLSVGGGIIGVMFGLVLPFVVSRLTDMMTIVTPFSVILAFGISGAVGVIFGLYPARAAASLDPIVALRRE